MIQQNVKLRTFGFARPCTKTFAVNAHPHSPSTARLAIEFITCASTCRASSPLWLHPCMHPATGVPKHKMWTFSSPTMSSARGAVDSGRDARALVRFQHVHAKMWWRCRALLPAAHVAPTFLLHTPFVDSMRFKKTPKGHSPGKCWACLAALQPPSRPVLRWRAWLVSCGSFAAKSPSAIFLASWANTRRKSQLSYLGEKSWANTRS